MQNATGREAGFFFAGAAAALATLAACLCARCVAAQMRTRRHGAPRLALWDIRCACPLLEIRRI